MNNEAHDERDPVHRIRAWAEKTGLPLELNTRLAFETEKSVFDVESSVSFVDPESGKGREIDVVASYRGDYWGRFDIAIECKAADKPWLVVVDEKPRAHRARIEQFGILSDSSREVLGGADGLAAFVHHPPGRYLADHRIDGFAFKQAFSNKDVDDAYAASMSALKASVAIAASAEHAKVHCVWPVVVVESPIVVCALNAEAVAGAINYYETDFAEYLFTAYLPEKTSSIIRVVRRDALGGFVQLATTFADLLYTELPPLIRRSFAIERLHRRFPDIGNAK